MAPVASVSNQAMADTASVAPTMPVPTQPQPATARPSAASGLLAARNQLRSQTKRGQEEQTAAVSPKKALTAPAKKSQPQ